MSSNAEPGDPIAATGLDVGGPLDLVEGGLTGAPILGVAALVGLLLVPFAFTVDLPKTLGPADFGGMPLAPCYGGAPPLAHECLSVCQTWSLVQSF